MENLKVKKEKVTQKTNIAEMPELTQFELTKALYTSSIFSKFELTPSSKLFLWALCTHYNPQKETMFPSQNNVAKKLGISTKSAERAVKELSEKGLLNYTTKRVNHYVFSEKFFEIIKMSLTVRQIVGKKTRQNVGLTNNHEQKNNNGNFKNSFFTSAKPLREGGKALPSIEETQKYIENIEMARKNCKNPLEFNKDEAFRWLNSMPKWMVEKSKMALKLVKKYKFDEFSHILITK